MKLSSKMHSKSKNRPGLSETGSAFEKLVHQKLESKQKREAKKAEILRKMESQIRRSKISDKRLGQHNPNISNDKKMLMRFTRERMKANKAKKFDLEEGGEEDEFIGLTHMGKSIDEIDDFKEKIEHSDEDDYSDRELEKRNFIWKI